MTHIKPDAQPRLSKKPGRRMQKTDRIQASNKMQKYRSSEFKQKNRCRHLEEPDTEERARTDTEKVTK